MDLGAQKGKGGLGWALIKFSRTPTLQIKQ